jgi:predicted HicB family RNase H-like nuclease
LQLIEDEFPLSLPDDLKARATDLAQQQGISLNEFIAAAIHEKVEELQDSTREGQQ